MRSGGKVWKWRLDVGSARSEVCRLQSRHSPRTLTVSNTPLYFPVLWCTPLYFAVLCYALLYSAWLYCALLKGDWLSVCSLVSCSALGLYYPDPAVLQAELQTLNPVLCTSQLLCLALIQQLWYFCALNIHSQKDALKINLHIKLGILNWS